MLSLTSERLFATEPQSTMFVKIYKQKIFFLKKQLMDTSLFYIKININI